MTDTCIICGLPVAGLPEEKNIMCALCYHGYIGTLPDRSPDKDYNQMVSVSVAKEELRQILTVRGII